MEDYLFREDLETLDPQVARLIELERERQVRKLILIASESVIPGAIREALGSIFTNIYAEGYPPPETREMTEAEILDYENRLANYRRYGDLRYYMGVEYADVAEALARRRCAEAFATDAIPPERIYANVQPLSGAPANTAVYEALLERDDVIMGLALSHGGHLTHGSAVNLSGERYTAVSYHVDPQTELLDYDQIEALAMEHRPKLIIAGYTSYPRVPDWARFRRIADRAGAYLMADIAHVAGMVAAGVYANPIEHAHAVTFTTHKSLCGPRGACILTTDPRLSRRIDRAVFPGLQGGPHVNKFVAMAVAFRLARTETFRALQRQTIANAQALARFLQQRELRVVHGGTDTHLLLVDCKTIRGPYGDPLLGDTAARVLDQVGIVCNRNTIPGDPSPGLASGIRLGTPWVTQRGLREEHMEQLAAFIARTLHAIQPITYPGRRGPVYRGKVDFGVLERIRPLVADLASQAGIEQDVPCTGYPHYCLTPDRRSPEAGWRRIEVEGTAALAFLNLVLVEEINDLAPQEWRPATLLEADGRLMARVYVGRAGEGYRRYQLVTRSGQMRRVLAWLRDLSDGYVLFDPDDLQAKLPGPVVVRDLGVTESPGDPLPENAFQPALSFKPYYVGLSAHREEEPRGESLRPFSHQPVEQPLRRTPLYEAHQRLGAHFVPFAGWEMPLRYGTVADEHQAVREAAGLFDVGHMGIFEVSGPSAAPFLDFVTTNDANRLRPGESHYGFLLDPRGRVLDDLMVYMRDVDRYLLVVNAANAEKDWAWLSALNRGEVQIDPQRPWARLPFSASLANLHAGSDKVNGRVNLALQGPRSRDILLAWLAASPGETAEIEGQLSTLRRTQLVEVRWPWKDAPDGAFDLLIARTGYTGESIGFEIFPRAQAASLLWDLLLQFGEEFGLRPAGLAARDSLRIEAGLPLYGHELAGPLDLRPDDAGLEGYVKVYKPFFIGRAAYQEHAAARTMAVIRFRLDEKGVSVPKQGDRVVDRRGRVIGQVTSCALSTEGFLVGMAYVDRRFTDPGTTINVLSTAREPAAKPLAELELGDRVAVAQPATVLRR